MILVLSTVCAGIVLIFAGSTDWGQRIQLTLQIEGDGRDYFRHEWTVQEFSIITRAGIIKRDTYISLTPCEFCVTIATAAMLPSLEVLFAPFTYRQAPWWELHVDGELEARRCEPQDVRITALIAVRRVHPFISGRQRGCD
jgi:hypothetical protein